MQRTIYFLRHAKSDWSVSGQKDFDRELNQRGQTDAPKMGRRLFELGVSPEIIYASPARRTTDTAELVAEQLHYNTDLVVFEEQIYEASVRSLLNFINALDDKYSRVMLIGHNPTLTYLAESLTKSELGNIPTCGAVNIEFNLDSWKEVSQGNGELKWFIYPKDKDTD